RCEARGGELPELSLPPLDVPNESAAGGEGRRGRSPAAGGGDEPAHAPAVRLLPARPGARHNRVVLPVLARRRQSARLPARARHHGPGVPAPDRAGGRAALLPVSVLLARRR